MTVDERIAHVVGRARLIWAIMMLCVVVVTATTLPSFYMIFLIPFGVVSYVLCLFTAFMILRETITVEDMELSLRSEKLDAGEIPDEYLSPIQGVSDEIIGCIDGNPMYEWVDILDPTTKKVERFAYFGIASYDKRGIPSLPSSDAKIFAHIKGVVYARDLQPV